MSQIDSHGSQLGPGTIPGFASLPPPKRLFVPLASGRVPIEAGEVRKGNVRRGEALAGGNLASGFTPVAPVSGTVVGVCEVELTTGRRAQALEIETDAAQPEPRAEELAPPGIKLSELLERASALGVWADRCTTPDLIGQLHAALKRPVDLIICNLLEADNAPLNAAIVRGGASDVVAGVLALATALANRVQFVADAEQYDAVAAALRQANASYAKLIQFPNNYPQADPTILLYMLTGRRLRPGRLPVEQGVLMLDGAAALALGQAIEQARPMIEVPVVVRERGMGRVHLIAAAVGTPVGHLLEQLNISAAGMSVRLGAVLRDVRIGADAILAGGEMRLDVGAIDAEINPEPCIRCGWCVAACPTRIHPAGLLEAAQENDEELAESYGLHACIECGICSYVCPSRLPLLAAIRSLKGRGGSEVPRASRP
jgi:electron transport complex protein RnfC